MLEAIYIRDFQRHSKLKITLDSSITTLIGPSDVGKSAVLRAIRWVCTNSPSGDSFIRDGAECVDVRLVVDGKKILRRRGNGDNLYSLDDERFVAFGSSVPDSISCVVNVGGGNFQGQHDSVFWFSETAGGVSRRLNSVVDLGVIDDSLASIVHEVRNFQVRVNIAREKLLAVKSLSEKLDWVVEADRQYAVVESISKTRVELLASISRLAGIRKDYDSVEKVRRDSRYMFESARSVGLLGSECRKVCSRLLSLSDLLVLWRSTVEASSRGIPDLTDVEVCMKSYTIVSGRRKSLENMVRSLLAQQEKSEELCELASQEWENLRSVSDGLCPICGREFGGG